MSSYFAKPIKESKRVTWKVVIHLLDVSHLIHQIWSGKYTENYVRNWEDRAQLQIYLEHFTTYVTQLTQTSNYTESAESLEIKTNTLSKVTIGVKLIHILAME